MRVFAVDISALLVPRSENPNKKKKADEETDEAFKFLKLSADLHNVREMNQWVFDGWVPSILSSLDPSNRLMLEVWLSENNVPYSNLVFGVDSPEYTCWQLDADFYITADKEVAGRVADIGQCQVGSVYLLVDRWDSGTEIEGVDVIRTFKNISEKEKK